MPKIKLYCPYCHKEMVSQCWNGQGWTYYESDESKLPYLSIKKHECKEKQEATDDKA